MKVYNRAEKDYIEVVESGSKSLDMLYNTAYGRVLQKLVIQPWISTVGGFFVRTKLSKKKIPSFVKENNIDLSEYIKEEYTSFENFFVRNIDMKYRPMEDDPCRLISPADSKVLCYKIDDNLTLNIKGSQYTLNELTGESSELDTFSGGNCIVFRLSVDDYHHYCYIDDGKMLKTNEIKGVLHTVRSISKDYKIYKENSRVVSILDTEHFGRVLHVEVGALMVGKIINKNLNSFKKGEEKGHFELGGSTIVLLFEKDKILIDEDIMKHSNSDIETKVRYRESIGRTLH